MKKYIFNVVIKKNHIITKVLSFKYLKDNDNTYFKPNDLYKFENKYYDYLWSLDIYENPSNYANKNHNGYEFLNYKIDGYEIGAKSILIE